MPYGLPGVMAARRGRLLRLHRLRRRLDDRRGSQEPEPRPADRHHRVAGHLHACSTSRSPRVLTGIVPVVQFKDDAQFLNAPVGYALAVINMDWAAGLVSAGAVAGITSVLLVMLMSQPRIFFAMSRDRLLPAGVSKVHPKFRTPYITTIITGVVVAIVAGLHADPGARRDDQHRHAVRVRGRLRARCMMLRAKRPDAHRPVQGAGRAARSRARRGVSCLYLMVSLSVMTWVRFLVWLDLGMIIYWFYGRTHSPLVDQAESARAERRREVRQLPEDGRLHGAVQRLLHHAARAADRVGRHERGARQVARARRASSAGSACTSIPRSPTRSASRSSRLGAVVVIAGWRSDDVAQVRSRRRVRTLAATVGRPSRPLSRSFECPPASSTARRRRRDPRVRACPGRAPSPTRAGRPPGLGIVLVGDDPASEIYVRNKVKAGTDSGLRVDLQRLPATATLDDLLALVAAS